jgi:polysaccharide biosynthesis protein PslH
VTRATRILYLTKALPFPADVGVRQRILNIGKILSSLGRVTLASLARGPSAEHVAETRRFFPRLELLATRPWTDTVPERLLDQIGLQVMRRRLEPDSAGRLSQLLGEHDVVWIHDRLTADFAGMARCGCSVLDIDDIAHTKLELASRFASSRLRAFGLRRQVRRLKHVESSVGRRFDVLSVCSVEDRAYLSHFVDVDRIVVVPNGFVAPEAPPVIHKPRERRLGIIGHLGYEPNQDGLVWFVESIWPLVRARVPDAEFRVVGRTPAHARLPQAEGVVYLGFVDDPGPEMSSWSAMAVPLRIGGGTRIKILEAFSRGCPVVSTPLGAHGLGLDHARQALLADDPAEFARSCITLLTQPEIGHALAAAGWATFEQAYSWDRVAPSVEEAVVKAYRHGRCFVRTSA